MSRLPPQQHVVTRQWLAPFDGFALALQPGLPLLADLRCGDFVITNRHVVGSVRIGYELMKSLLCQDQRHTHTAFNSSELRRNKQVGGGGKSLYIALPTETASSVNSGCGVPLSSLQACQQYLGGLGAAPLAKKLGESCGFRSQYLEGWAPDVRATIGGDCLREPFLCGGFTEAGEGQQARVDTAAGYHDGTGWFILLCQARIQAPTKGLPSGVTAARTQ